MIMVFIFVTKYKKHELCYVFTYQFCIELVFFP